MQTFSETPKAGYGANDQLSPAEWEVFDDTTVESLFQNWAEEMVKKGQTLNLRKQFLMRCRALFQSGKLG